MATDPNCALAGRRIVITRPQGQAAALADALVARGAEPVCIPVIEIEPLPVSDEFAALIDALATFSLAFFVSPNAVEHGLAAVRARRPWPAGLRVATVGRGSERALAEAGFDDVIAPASGFDSEAVLALPAFSAEAVTGKRIIIFRGNGGRDLLGDTLGQRGAAVSYASCYARRIPGEGGGRLRAMAGSVDALVLTSSEGVGNLAAMLGEGLPEVLGIAVFAPHPRICERARACGFRTVIETAAGDAGVVAGLSHHFLGR